MSGEPRFRIGQYVVDTERHMCVEVVGWINTIHWNDEAEIYVLSDDDGELYLAPSWGDRLKSYQEAYGQDD